MPVAIPKRERAIINPWVASIVFLKTGGSSGVVPGNLPSSIPKNTTEQQRRKNRLPNTATTAAAVTEAERSTGESITDLYITSRRTGESNR